MAEQILTLNHYASVDYHDGQLHSHSLSVLVLIGHGAAAKTNNASYPRWTVNQSFTLLNWFSHTVMEQDWLLYHLPRPHFLVFYSALPPGSQEVAHWVWVLSVGSSGTRLLMAWTGSNLGLSVLKTGCHRCLLKYGVIIWGQSAIKYNYLHYKLIKKKCKTTLMIHFFQPSIK